MCEHFAHIQAVAAEAEPGTAATEKCAPPGWRWELMLGPL